MLGDAKVPEGQLWSRSQEAPRLMGRWAGGTGWARVRAPVFRSPWSGEVRVLESGSWGRAAKVLSGRGGEVV